MDKPIKVSQKSINDFLARNPLPELILKGLARGQLGMLIAPPASGKSMLSLLIAYELALAINIVGIRAPASKPLRTLYWPAEDGLHETIKRISSHLAVIPGYHHDAIEKNVSIWGASDPILQSARYGGHSDVEDSFNRLVKAAQDFDLIIVDTVREAIGSASEVDDDIFIKERFKELAKQTNAAILAVHHPTKNVIRGLEGVSTASGSGLSCTIAYSRCHFYISQIKEGKSKSDVLHVTQPKANFLNPEDKVNFLAPIGFTSLLDAAFADVDDRRAESSATPGQSLAGEDRVQKPDAVDDIPRKSPRVITVDKSSISLDSKSRAQKRKEDDSPISPSLLQLFKDKKQIE